MRSAYLHYLYKQEINKVEISFRLFQGFMLCDVSTDPTIVWTFPKPTNTTLWCNTGTHTKAIEFNY